MTHHEFRYASHPDDARNYSTEDLRKHFLIGKLFIPDAISLCYTMYDRYIVGGAFPSQKDLQLETIPYLKSDNFLDRREMGIINVGGNGSVLVDGVKFQLSRKDALYIGKGVKEVIFNRGDNPFIM